MPRETSSKAPGRSPVSGSTSPRTCSIAASKVSRAKSRMGVSSKGSGTGSLKKSDTSSGEKPPARRSFLSMTFCSTSTTGSAVVYPPIPSALENSTSKSVVLTSKSVVLTSKSVVLIAGVASSIAGATVSTTGVLLLTNSEISSSLKPPTRKSRISC